MGPSHPTAGRPGNQQQTLAPLTASFEDLPEGHDGSSAFTVRLAFTDEVALDVTGGTVKRARRVAPPGNEQWTITIEPDGHGAVSVLLPATTDCDATGAICTADGRTLSGGVAVQIAGPSGPGLSVADAQAQEGPGASAGLAIGRSWAAGSYRNSAGHFRERGFRPPIPARDFR